MICKMEQRAVQTIIGIYFSNRASVGPLEMNWINEIKTNNTNRIILCHYMGKKDCVCHSYDELWVDMSVFHSIAPAKYFENIFQVLSNYIIKFKT